MKISVIAVNHNSYPELEGFLESIHECFEKGQHQVNVEILDNSTAYNPSCNDRLIENFEKVINLKILRMPNDGYFGTIHNYLKSTKKNGGANYVIISNVDIGLDKEFARRLDECEISPSVGILAPSIVTMSGIDKNPKIVKPISKRKLQLNRFLFRFSVLHVLLVQVNFIRLNIRRKNLKRLETEYEVRDIYAAHGSFIIFTQVGFELFSKLSYPIFLFGEEIFLAEEFKKHGLQTLFQPKVQVFDKEHASTGKLASRKYREFNVEALTYLINHYSWRN